jgi:hypothetical protein
MGNKNSYKISNDNEIRDVNIPPKNLVADRTMFLHHDIYIYMRTSRDGKTHNQIGR